MLTEVIKTIGVNLTILSYDYTNRRAADYFSPLSLQKQHGNCKVYVCA